MKLVIELLAGVATGVGAYYLAWTDRAADEAGPAVRQDSDASGERPHARDAPPPAPDNTGPPSARAGGGSGAGPSAEPSAGARPSAEPRDGTGSSAGPRSGMGSSAGPRTGTGLSAEERRVLEQKSAMNTLRNEIIVASSKDMYLRGTDVMNCLEGIQLAGEQKLWFAVDVVSTPLEATIKRWRFVEIAEGEPLPASFPSCAVKALGGGQRFVPPEGFRFPQYEGEVRILYVIPAPSED